MEYMAAQMDRQIEGAQLRYDAAIEDGLQPAFPVADYDHQTFKPATVDEARRQLSGMTLRDYFAAKALSTVQAYSHEDVATWAPEDFAKHAYTLADAMLAARSA
ncbi:hypothetical protein L9Z73_29365 [Pseudomonas sp. TNT11]|uniref:Uncharacterized protein n=1 Tax=Pseudomonas emilianonis TaxID=2915812 RepID=A0ABT0ERA0_9PSED|nr:hypothetical protein [Pseudomonas emilianonis]MCK1788271.1 hypothetical protein [Pseudomonas emilianonis]